MPTVLVVEDDQTLLEGLELFLRIEGFETTGATNGRRGLEIARSKRPDVIVTNFQMPGLGGLELTKSVRRDPVLKRTPIVFTTANNSVSLRDRALHAGADAFLSKPFQAAALLSTIRKLLELSEAET